MTEEERLQERVRELEARLETASDSDDHLRFLETMDRIEAAIRGALSQRSMLSDVLDVTLDVLGVDRAWLLYPCDPSTPTYQVPMERTRPEYPGAGMTEEDVPTEPMVFELFQNALSSAAPIFLDRARIEREMEVAQRFGIRGQILSAIHPPVGEPWPSVCTTARPRIPSQPPSTCVFSRASADDSQMRSACG